MPNVWPSNAAQGGGQVQEGRHRSAAARRRGFPASVPTSRNTGGPPSGDSTSGGRGGRARLEPFPDGLAELFVGGRVHCGTTRARTRAAARRTGAHGGDGIGLARAERLVRLATRACSSRSAVTRCGWRSGSNAPCPGRIRRRARPRAGAPGCRMATPAASSMRRSGPRRSLG
jgi:hypothetical protein